MQHDDDNDKEEENAAESEENDKQDGLQPLADGLVIRGGSRGGLGWAWPTLATYS